jgi:hypothetical protein
MEAKLLDSSWMRIAVSHRTLVQGMAWGVIGGLSATMVMDLIMIGAFLAAGLSPFTCYAIVGDTLARLFALQDTSGGVLLGAAAHYLIGPVMGAIFGIAARSVPSLQAGSWKKAILFAVLYAEILSQPMLALTPVLLRMTASETVQWYSGSFAMHLIWGCVLGALWSQGVRLPAASLVEAPRK